MRSTWYIYCGALFERRVENRVFSWSTRHFPLFLSIATSTKFHPFHMNDTAKDREESCDQYGTNKFIWIRRWGGVEYVWYETTGVTGCSEIVGSSPSFLHWLYSWLSSPIEAETLAFACGVSDQKLWNLRGNKVAMTTAIGAPQVKTSMPTYHIALYSTFLAFAAIIQSTL